MAVLQGPEFYISKRAGRAIIDHALIDEGDTILVALSGGKDSLTLLQILRDRQKFVPIRYQLVAAHIDFGFHRSLPGQLSRHCKKLGVPFHRVKLDVLRKAPREKINCFWCSWNRRKALFQLADRLGIRKIAFGHHKDDIAQTMLMNLFFHGEISTMCPRQELFQGKIVIIRPLAYVDESMIRTFARRMRFSVQTCRCPRGDLSQRHAVAGIIRDLEKICPEVKTNLTKSTGRIKRDYLG
jgi:tRNA 2-thiocytidine biosynthesis protein TtcA